MTHSRMHLAVPTICTEVQFDTQTTQYLLMLGAVSCGLS